MRFMNKPRLTFTLLTFAFGALVLSEKISVASVKHLTETGPAATPFAHIRFCLRYPDDCKVSNGADTSKPVTLSSARRDDLQNVNDHVNNAIVARRQYDSAAFEKWLIYPLSGDCNDFAVSKRHLLLQKGWPDHALLLAEVKLRSGEHHLVLVARTTDGDIVLDNLTPALRPVIEANAEYEWLRMASKDNPQYWSKVRAPS